jgi:hypothetical protein
MPSPPTAELRGIVQLQPRLQRTGQRRMFREQLPQLGVLIALALGFGLGMYLHRKPGSRR